MMTIAHTTMIYEMLLKEESWVFITKRTFFLFPFFIITISRRWMLVESIVTMRILFPVFFFPLYCIYIRK